MSRDIICEDEERSYFLIDIPCHPYFVNKEIAIVSSGVKEGDVTKELTERQIVIIEMIKEDTYVTTYEMSQKTGVVTRTIKRDLEYLQSAGVIIRIGGRKDGHWEVLGKVDIPFLVNFQTIRFSKNRQTPFPYDMPKSRDLVDTQRAMLFSCR